MDGLLFLKERNWCIEGPWSNFETILNYFHFSLLILRHMAIRGSKTQVKLQSDCQNSMQSRVGNDESASLRTKKWMATRLLFWHCSGLHKRCLINQACSSYKSIMKRQFWGQSDDSWWLVELKVPPLAQSTIFLSVISDWNILRLVSLIHG